MRQVAPGSIVKATASHMPMIRKWYKGWGIKAPKIEYFSTTGYICDNRVAGWLYFTNSDLVMIECVIANPNSVPSLRKESLNKLIGFLIDTSINAGYSSIFGISKHPGIAKVAERYNFRLSNDFKVFALSEDDSDLY